MTSFFRIHILLLFDSSSESYILFMECAKIAQLCNLRFHGGHRIPVDYDIYIKRLLPKGGSCPICLICAGFCHLHCATLSISRALSLHHANSCIKKVLCRHIHDDAALDDEEWKLMEANTLSPPYYPTSPS